jgi:hypothetical protein
MGKVLRSLFVQGPNSLIRAQKHRRRAPRDAPANNNNNNGTWAEDRAGDGELTNAKFEAYYRAQGIIPDDQWPAFLAALRKPLPSSFRVTGSRQCVPCPEIAGGFLK